MNKRSRLVRIVIAAVLALPMAGASAGVLAEAFGFAVGGAWIGLPAAAAVLLGALAAGSGALAVVAAVLAAAPEQKRKVRRATRAHGACWRRRRWSSGWRFC